MQIWSVFCLCSLQSAPLHVTLKKYTGEHIQNRSIQLNVAHMCQVKPYEKQRPSFLRRPSFSNICWLNCQESCPLSRSLATDRAVDRCIQTRARAQDVRHATLTQWQGAGDVLSHREVPASCVGDIRAPARALTLTLPRPLSRVCVCVLRPTPRVYRTLG